MKQLTGMALGFFLAVPAAAGDVYRWVDERGQVHFGDRPPPRADATLQQTPPAGDGAAPAEGGLRSGERARLREIGQRESREAADRNARDRQAAAEEKRRAHQGDQDAQRCAGYRRKISEYERRLRAGCRVSKCNSYNAQLESYKRKAAPVCR